ncbi:MAG: alpha/beta hydrolase [Solirubrobacterales bacterium]|nr:MAG: alpha/beta hydrolase [Solirubrobacterales bacterium]
MPYFAHEGQRIAYTEYGDGPRAVVLVHGLLLSQRMQEPLARELARHGNRVITLDVLGHGRSDRPRDMSRYSMSIFATQVLALLEHLELEEAVVGGTSLGANVTLELVSLAPERVRGMIIEMPVLDNALMACALAFTPLMVALTFGEPIMRAVARVTGLVPERALPLWGDIVLDLFRQDPAPSAAILHGIFFGRTAPHSSERRTFTQPALIIGHHRDPVHPFSDAGMLADELPNAQLLEASSLLELRMSPERLTGEITTFVQRCWRRRARGRAGGRRVAARA